MQQKLIRQLHTPTYKNGKPNSSRIALIQTQNGWQERLYRFNQFLEACQQIPPELEDVYFSLNGFGRHRRTDSVVQINNLFADIDIYGLFQDPDFVLESVHELIPDTIPKPGMVCYSGRGLWLIWHLVPLPKEALARWALMQEHLVNLLGHLGADKKVRDVTRVMRFPGSLNSKSQTRVRFEIWHEERYALHDLEKLYPPPKKNRSTSKRAKPKESTPVHPKFFTPSSLNLGIIEDLKRLAELRGRQLKGHREYFLFIWRNCLAQLGTSPEESERQIRSVALEFLGSERLPDREWVKSTMSAYRASFECKDGTQVQGYRLKKQWIIDALAITPEEQVKMQILIGTAEKYDRKNTKRRPQKAKQSRAEYLASYKEQRAKIRQLKHDEPKLTGKEIAMRLNLSSKTVYRALQN